MCLALTLDDLPKTDMAWAIASFPIQRMASEPEITAGFRFDSMVNVKPLPIDKNTASATSTVTASHVLTACFLLGIDHNEDRT
jgi:hypothetical protein